MSIKFNLERLAKADGVVYVVAQHFIPDEGWARASVGMGQRGPLYDQEHTADNARVNAIAKLAQAQVNYLARHPALGDYRLTVGNFSINVVRNEHLREAVAVVTVTSHPVKKSIHRSIRVCWKSSPRRSLARPEPAAAPQEGAGS